MITIAAAPIMAPPNSGTAHTIPNGPRHGSQVVIPTSLSSSSTGSSNTSRSCCAFQMPLHYPRFKKADYEKMAESQLDCLLREYGLPTNVGDLNQKRKFAMGAFLWPDEY